MSKLYNRVKVSTATTGTGTITLGSAVTGYQTFASAGVQNGDVVSYVIEDANGNVEFGTGTYTSSGTTLSRTVTQSCISGTWGTTAISLSGTAEVFISPLAADMPLIPDGGSLTLSGAFSTTFTVSGSTSLTLPTSGTVTALGNTTTGSGNIVLATSPTLTTPTLGVATATSVNGHTFPATASTVLTTGNTATITKGYSVTPNNLGNLPASTTTLDPANGNYQYATHNATTGTVTIAAPASDCAIDVLVTNASTGTLVSLTLSGFTAPTGGGGDTWAITNNNRYILMVRRISGVSTYAWKALQ